MYTSYFGLSALPFSIAPDPNYLFMSNRHREALSHLTYGLGTTGGFVLLTGEVGTGKTTLSRRLMEQLPKNTQTAFILNPTLSSQELLATLCDQLKIRYRKTGATLKTLTDKIQDKLLKNHQNNINTLLIVDEAQHLRVEVLEQLRLLTNFETNTKKLLQVILIGQPELQQLLQRRDLRQLSQRITARYHLMPLNKIEVSQYIQHRLSVANCYRTIFDKRAVLIIHQLSQGIPRLINLLCDRSLWIAYGENKSVIEKKTVIKASTEALGAEYIPALWWQKSPIKFTLIILLLSSAIAGGIWWGQQHSITSIVTTVESLQKSPQTVTNKSVEKQEAINSMPAVAKKIFTTTLLTENKTRLDQNKIVAQTSNKLALNAHKPIVLGYKSKEYQQHLLNSKSPIKSKEKSIRSSITDLKIKAVNGVSPTLLQHFKTAIKATDRPNYTENVSVNYANVKPIAEMPVWLQKALPSVKFSQHIYASDGRGWVRVNGKDVHEGEKIAVGVMLEKILPQKVILVFRGATFSMAALSAW